MLFCPAVARTFVGARALRHVKALAVPVTTPRRSTRTTRPLPHTPAHAVLCSTAPAQPPAVPIIRHAPAAYTVLRLRAAPSMNAVHGSFTPPHLLNSRLSPARNSTSATPQPSLTAAPGTHRNPAVYASSSAMTGRKRKADDDGGSSDDRMSASPSMAAAELPRQPTRHMKRMRTNLSGRPLPLPRLLETLTADEMRNLLQSICQRHPDIGNEVVSTAPRPSIQSTLEVLAKYEATFQAAFPFGGRSSSDYAYNSSSNCSSL
jgi:hypothetical protein